MTYKNTFNSLFADASNKIAPISLFALDIVNFTFDKDKY